MARSRWQSGLKKKRSRDEQTVESTVSQSDSKRLMDRVDQLEKKQRLLTTEAVRLREENRLLRREVKILSNAVMEIYQLLYQLIGKKSPDSRIHSRTDPL